jgi:pimeloyl-ACP methyl ester carboxylesterase
MSDGAVIRLRQYGHPGRSRLVLSHGNGLAINAYLPFWLPLAEEFELLLFDVRNHGENPLHDPTAHRWERIAKDMGEVFAGIQAHFGQAATIGVFHSLSAVAALMHDLSAEPNWTALVLFDPPLYPPLGHPLQPNAQAEINTMARRALRRSAHYVSPERFAAQLARRPAFKGLVPGAHLLFARSTLRRDDSGNWVLCNPKELEARIYATNIDATIWQRLPTLRQPMILIGADPVCPHAGAPARICRAIHDELGMDYRMIAGTSHFLQIEKPSACRHVLSNFLARHRLH